MKEIKLTEVLYAKVDDEDFDSLNNYKWYALKSRNTFYAARNVTINKKIKCYLMHRVVLNLTKRTVLCDHMDRNGLNNQKINLRACSNSENQLNRGPQNIIGSSKYKGVCWNKNHKKWIAKICKNYVSIYIGAFDDEKDAADAYDNYAIKLFGEFAYTNNCRNNKPT